MPVECEHPECDQPADFDLETVAGSVALCNPHIAEVTAHRMYPDWFMDLIAQHADRNGHDG